ncbi:proline-specific peptidase [Wolfiporia cocos MD-104 SS10]|uniref:Proline-specific peptidase n=1 Tax=Wolfiporia cocos (strain MD-104) TaxID=742152 RepID=A0A2H3J3B8_WOLCO|nr:proline-specific peptidase [Wolfiporia cocos MD-104 SS10]
MIENTGTIPFAYGNETFHTWYRVVGDLSSGARPLVALHGGPGISHHYMLPHATISASHNIPVIFYDQIGIGNSAHLPDKPKEFWTVDLFVDELDNILAHFGISGDFDLLGHSWGGMLAAHYASHRRPKGLKHLIITNASASMELWECGTTKLLEGLEKEVRDIVKKHEQEGTMDSDEYQDCMQVFYNKHVCTLNPWPKQLLQSFEEMSKDPTVYSTMIGPSEFNIAGTLKTWSCIDQLHQIEVPTLIINSPDDEAQDVNLVPLFQRVPKVKWAQLAHCTHMPFFEEPGRYFEIVGDFMKL